MVTGVGGGDAYRRKKRHKIVTPQPICPTSFSAEAQSRRLTSPGPNLGSDAHARGWGWANPGWPVHRTGSCWPLAECANWARGMYDSSVDLRLCWVADGALLGPPVLPVPVSPCARSAAAPGVRPRGGFRELRHSARGNLATRRPRKRALSSSSSSSGEGGYPAGVRTVHRDVAALRARFPGTASCARKFGCFGCPQPTFHVPPPSVPCCFKRPMLILCVPCGAYAPQASPSTWFASV